MFIFLVILFLFVIALALIVLQWVRPVFRFTWLIAAGGTLIVWFGILLWQLQKPLFFNLPPWEPARLFINGPSFVSDALSWPYAFSLITLALAVILTSTVQEDYPNPMSWSGSLLLTGFGLLAVLADNPLTLLLAWTAIDLAELISQLRSVNGPRASEQVVIAFAARIAGSLILIWASMVSLSTGTPLDFLSTPPEVGFYLVLAAGLRLGVLPLHLPYSSESALRRGFGTTLRLVSAASSLTLLARIPGPSMISPITPFIMVLVLFAAVYGGWMWLQAPNDLNGRPYWIIGIASLSIVSALNGNPAGTVAWGCVLVLAGGALFLSSVQGTWLTRLLTAGIWGLSALPLSLTASGLQATPQTLGFSWPFLIVAQALLMAGYFRHARYAFGERYDTQPTWSKNVYPVGIAVLLAVEILIGLWGWEGSFRFGNILAAVIVSILTALTIRFGPRLWSRRRIQAHWVGTSTATTWTNWFYRLLAGLYRGLSRVSRVVSNVLEGDGGVLWVLLILALFISLLSQGSL